MWDGKRGQANKVVFASGLCVQKRKFVHDCMGKPIVMMVLGRDFSFYYAEVFAF